MTPFMRKSLKKLVQAIAERNLYQQNIYFARVKIQNELENV